MLLWAGLEWKEEMRAYLQLQYSSDGRSPAEVDRALGHAGLRLQGTVYVLDADDLIAALSEVHHALRGMGVRYTIVPSPGGREMRSGTAREIALGWREEGLISGGTLNLLDESPLEFREAALRDLRASVDRITDERREELMDRRIRQVRRAQHEDVRILLRSTNGVTFEQIIDVLDVDEEDLSQVLDDMIRDGEVRAEQRDHKVLYVLATPLVRPGG